MVNVSTLPILRHLFLSATDPGQVLHRPGLGGAGARESRHQSRHRAGDAGGVGGGQVRWLLIGQYCQYSLLIGQDGARGQR